MILVGGENLIDFIEGADGRFTTNVGGGPFNIAKTLARLGQNVGYLTPISTDAMGDKLATALLQDGVKLLAPRSKSPTSLALVTLDNGQPSYQFYRRKTAERRVTAPMLNRIIPKQARAFQLGSLALTSGGDAEAWAQIYIAQHKRGLFTALDPNIRPAFIKNRRVYMARLARVLAATDLLKLSDEDLEWLSPNEPLETAAQGLMQKYDIAMVVLTLGSEGAVGFYNAGRIEVMAAKVDDFKDTVGAGDTFMGTLLAQLSEREILTRKALKAAALPDLLATLKIAVKAAAINCGRSGCNPPTTAELLE